MEGGHLARRFRGARGHQTENNGNRKRGANCEMCKPGQMLNHILRVSISYVPEISWRKARPGGAAVRKSVGQDRQNPEVTTGLHDQ
jgi:hypothetical protein